MNTTAMHTTARDGTRTQYAVGRERAELALLTVSGATILCVLLASLGTLLS